MTSTSVMYLDPTDTATAARLDDLSSSLGEVAIDIDNPGHGRVAIYMSTAQATALRDSLTAALEGQS